MSYIVLRDIYNLDFDSPLANWIDKIDDEIIKRYQEGYVKDEYGCDTIEEAEAYCKSKGYCLAFPNPNSYDTLMILHHMIKNGEIDFEFKE